jgi:hypothetical protein
LILSGNSNLSAPLIVDELSLSGNADPSPVLPARKVDFSDPGSGLKPLANGLALVGAVGASWGSLVPSGVFAVVVVARNDLLASAASPVNRAALDPLRTMSQEDLLAMASTGREEMLRLGGGDKGQEWASLFEVEEDGLWTASTS